MRLCVLLAVVLSACSTPLEAGVIAGDGGADAGAGGAGEEQGMPEEPLAECIPTSIGVWDDFEAPLDGVSARFAPDGTTAIGFDGGHHCGAQGIKATASAGGAPALFVRTVPAIATPPKAASWSFLVSFELAAPTTKVRFASLVFEGGRRLAFEYAAGSLSLVERDDVAGTESVHAGLAPLGLGAFQRIDLRLDAATREATLKIGPPGGTAPTQVQKVDLELGRVTSEELGPSPPDAGTVTVRFDRAAVYVE